MKQPWSRSTLYRLSSNQGWRWIAKLLLRELADNWRTEKVLRLVGICGVVRSRSLVGYWISIHRSLITVTTTVFKGTLYMWNISYKLKKVYTVWKYCILERDFQSWHVLILSKVIQKTLPQGYHKSLSFLCQNQYSILYNRWIRSSKILSFVSSSWIHISLKWRVFNVLILTL